MMLVRWVDSLGLIFLGTSWVIGGQLRKIDKRAENKMGSNDSSLAGRHDNDGWDDDESSNFFGIGFVNG